MRALIGLALVAAMGLMANGAFAQDKKDDKIDGKKLVGKWTPKEDGKNGKVFLEFTKDGKVLVTGKLGEMELKIDGTYKLEGNKLALTLKKGEDTKSATITITKLTDTEMEGADEGGKSETFLRVKGKK